MSADAELPDSTMCEASKPTLFPDRIEWVDAHTGEVLCSTDSLDAPLSARAPIWPVVSRRADDAQLAEAEAFLEVVARTPNDTKCARYLSALLADAKWHRFGA